MKCSDFTKLLKELRGLVREFRKEPFKATKALIIFTIIIITVLTQWSGHTQQVPYAWLIVGLCLLVAVLLAVLFMAYRFDSKMT